MNSPKSSLTTSTSPLQEFTRGAIVGGVTPSSSWSTTSTSPLRISKLPPQLARRQSSSYNHVKNNALVSNSPFKARPSIKPSKIPTPSRATPKEDENKPELCVKRRQSKGLQGLVKEQVVTKSPFLGDKRPNTMIEVAPAPAPNLSVPKPLPPRAFSTLETTQPRTSTPPIPATPRNPRVADLSGRSSSPSPKSSLVSPKRLHGPRSLSASPSSESGRRQRRKTVTFDERCDVLEFDQDEASEEVIEPDDDGEDDYGFPHPPSPAISASTEGSFTSYSSDQALPSPGVESQESMSLDDSVAASEFDLPARTPHISRDEIRRRLMEQRIDGFGDIPDVASLQATPDMSFEQAPELAVAAPDVIGSNTIPVHARPDRVDLVIDAPFDFNEPGVDLGEIHSALDRLMLGVECGFGLDAIHCDSVDPEPATEGDMSGHIGANATDIGNDIEAGSITREVRQQQVREKHIQIEMTEITELLSTDEDTDEPVTPPSDAQRVRETLTPKMHDGVDISPPDTQLTHPATPLGRDGSMPSTDFEDHSGPDVSNAPDASFSISAAHAYPQIKTSISQDNQPVPDSASHSKIWSDSATPPPLPFDSPSPNDILPASGDLHPSSRLLSQPPPSTQDDTFLPYSFSMASTANHSVPPPVPPKDGHVIQQNDDRIKAHMRAEQPSYGEHGHLAAYPEGRPSRRRSLSTGDAEDLGSCTPAAQRRAGRLRDDRDANFLDVPLEQADDEQALGNLIDRELRMRKRPTVKDKNRMYRLRERENTIYASADDKVSHMSQAGDVDNGKAWRTVRRPSDMNEYSRQIKEYRAQQKPGKAHGKVFVKVLGIKGLNVPLPRHSTAFTCTLNNGIHFVTTPECQLSKDARIEQEFELIEHSKLEFTLTLTVRRDPHIVAQANANAISLATIPVAPAPPALSSRGGVRGFFGVGGSPKKTHKVAIAAAVRATPEPAADNLARYLKPDGTLARAFVSFKEIAKRCDTRLFETSFPLIGQRTDGSSRSSIVNPWSMGEIVLQIFRLPPLPGISPDQLPQSLEECHRGLRHINWHKVTYHEGVLTQNGGDCRTWRRRLLRVIGSNLVAFNDVTKKATTTIDLKKAIAVEDDDRTFAAMRSPSSVVSAHSRDEFDDVYRVERSFRLIFPNDEEISFFADNDEAKAKWLEVFRALIGHIPPNPLWAELIWQHQDDMARNFAPQVPQTTLPASRQMNVIHSRS